MAKARYWIDETIAQIAAWDRWLWSRPPGWYIAVLGVEALVIAVRPAAGALTTALVVACGFGLMLLEMRAITTARTEQVQQFEQLLERFAGLERIRSEQSEVREDLRERKAAGAKDNDLSVRALWLAGELLRFLGERGAAHHATDPEREQKRRVAAFVRIPLSMDPYEQETVMRFRQDFGSIAADLRRKFADEHLHDTEWDNSESWDSAYGNRIVYAAINGLRSLAAKLDEQ